jgi:hypothetical protein
MATAVAVGLLRSSVVIEEAYRPWAIKQGETQTGADPDQLKPKPPLPLFAD